MKNINKLVRDKIPEIISSKGNNFEIKILNDEEYFNSLNEKLKEELNEYLENFDLIELADLSEVIDAIIKYKNISKEEFENIKKEKALKNGKFDKRIFLKYLI